MIRKTAKLATLFTVGGLLYGLIEIAWRGHTHISMFVVGGLCFVLIGFRLSSFQLGSYKQKSDS